MHAIETQGGRMLLKDWLKKEKLRPSVFARAMGMSVSNMSRCIAGKQRPSAQFALKIEAATHGQVTRCEVIYPEDYIETDQQGNVQLLAAPKAHPHLADGIDLHGEPSIDLVDYYRWAFGINKKPSLVCACYFWAMLHPSLRRIETMPFDKGIAYTEAEYRKAQKRERRGRP